MSWGSAVGSDFTAAQGSAAMALITSHVESNVEVLGFASQLTDLGIHSGQSFAEVKRRVQLHNFGATNPSLLISDAQKKGIEVDAFIVITDNEVNQGTHPSKALRDYRQKTGIDAKLIVMGMTATDFTIADPQDSGMLDVVGFDANAPKVVSDFAAGKI
jgi:60 kDa SS-A/Ro ribonucleoprotein